MNTSSPFKQPKVRISETVDQAVKLERRNACKSNSPRARREDARTAVKLRGKIT
jgi:hypothetical protein